MKQKLWLQRLKRAKHDRRVPIGIWARYQKRIGKGIHFGLDFGIDWVFLRHGYLRFPEHMEFNQHQLQEIGKRRAINCKHPNRFTKEPIRLIDADITWQDWQVFKRMDLQIRRTSYVTYFRESVCGKYLIKVELDPDNYNHEGNLMELPDYAEPLSNQGGNNV